MSSFIAYDTISHVLGSFSQLVSSDNSSPNQISFLKKFPVDFVNYFN